MLSFRSVPRSRDDTNPNKLKSDLELAWEGFSSPESSPVSKRNAKSMEVNILDLLSTSPKKQQAKKIFIPPTFKSKQETKESPKKTNIDSSSFLFKMVTITTNDEFKVPSSLTGVTNVFKGPENQEIAWASFKKQIPDAKCCIVSAARFAFAFQDGKVQAKAFSGTAQNNIKSLSASGNLDDISIEDAIEMIEKVQPLEVLSFYSTSQFNYCVAIPIIDKNSKFESSNGMRYRATLTGYIFPFQMKRIQEESEKYDVFHLAPISML